MTSSRPYLVRAFYDWIVDNDCTPYLVVNALAPDVEVPQDYASDGQIVLNLAPRAVLNFYIDNEGISFNTRFGGIPTDIRVPMPAVLGIYARENGQGMMFQSEGGSPPAGPGPEKPRAMKKSGAKSGSGDSSTGSRPKLKIIK